MIFKGTWQQVLDGTKTQTRRPVKPGDDCLRSATDFYEVHTTIGRLKWVLGFDYAVQPGRGKKAVGRIRITKIRRERLQEITWQDAVAEGIPQYMRLGMPDSQEIYCQFWSLWNSLYRKPYDWESDPDVWVLEFERL